MTTQEFHASHPFRTAPDRDADFELDGLTVPYAGQTRMRLTITSGMADARVRIDPDATDLIAIDWGEGTPPRLRVSASELRVSWPDHDRIVAARGARRRVPRHRDRPPPGGRVDAADPRRALPLRRPTSRPASSRGSRSAAASATRASTCPRPGPSSRSGSPAASATSRCAGRPTPASPSRSAAGSPASASTTRASTRSAAAPASPPGPSTATPPATPSRSAAAPAACTSFLVEPRSASIAGRDLAACLVVRTGHGPVPPPSNRHGSGETGLAISQAWPFQRTILPSSPAAHMALPRTSMASSPVATASSDVQVAPSNRTAPMNPAANQAPAGASGGLTPTSVKLTVAEHVLRARRRPRRSRPGPTTSRRRNGRRTRRTRPLQTGTSLRRPRRRRPTRR